MIDGREPAIAAHFYRIPRISGQIVGIWPQHPRPCHAQILFMFALAVVLLGAVGECLYGFVHLDNLVTALEAFCPGTTKAVCVLKLCVFFGSHRRWHAWVQRLRGMLWAHHRPEGQQMLEELSTIANRLSLLLLSSGTMTNTAFNVQPLIMGLYRWMSQLPGQIELPFNIILPAFAVEQPLFSLSYVLLTASGACTVFAFSFVDGFFLCSCMYICGGFRLVQQDIRRVFADLHGDTVEVFTESMNVDIRRRLGVIVERHNAIIDLCTDLTRQFTVIVLMHFLSAAFVLCSTILDIMLNTSSLSGLTYICYTVAALTQLFLYCYGGNHVSESSAAVADVLYDIEWYKCDARTRKMILMILRRSQRAKTIAVPFFTPSLMAFGSILSTAGSYITLLKTFL
ncbi:odorant receptor 22c [Drosophila guanche]|uniref:Odorant receptor n=1 Tax=Drosophila guanche TaxID=7266 RepID=A0A3B0JBA2_DROGU|nr:odorant receptor 22c [Drosophila guanche]SPP79305.1 blast:Odorant receptor 22c [Drosophila guanche]